MRRTWLREPPATNLLAHHFGELTAYADDFAQRPLTFGSFNNVPKLTLRTLAHGCQLYDGGRLALGWRFTIKTNSMGPGQVHLIVRVQ